LTSVWGRKGPKQGMDGKLRKAGGKRSYVKKRLNLLAGPVLGAAGVGGGVVGGCWEEERKKIRPPR